MRWRKTLSALACCAVVGVGGTLFAAEPAARVAKEPATKTDAKTTDAKGQVSVDDHGKILAAKTFRTSKLIGMNVRNMKGEALGTINDFVIDLGTGKVQYAAMSVGGVLGVGDKLLAIPFSELKFDHGQDEMFFVLNMNKDKIAAAPGFNQNDWPDFADPSWSRKIDEHYRKTETRTGVQETAPRAD
jgi:sporulation protein YlmC with PRC-barrel domain